MNILPRGTVPLTVKFHHGSIAGMGRAVELAIRAVHALAGEASHQKRLDEARMHLGFISDDNRAELPRDVLETLDEAFEESGSAEEQAHRVSVAIIAILRADS
jgi:hypothetical protein